jgi:anti-anti-sigma factor
MRITQDELQGILKISGALDIGNADALREALSEGLRRYPEFKLDLSAIDSCDTACLQLLWSARQSALRQGNTWQVGAWSPAMEAAGAAIGLSLKRLAEPHSDAAEEVAATVERGPHGEQ